MLLQLALLPLLVAVQANTLQQPHKRATCPPRLSSTVTLTVTVTASNTGSATSPSQAVCSATSAPASQSTVTITQTKTATTTKTDYDDSSSASVSTSAGGASGTGALVTAFFGLDGDYPSVGALNLPFIVPNASHAAQSTSYSSSTSSLSSSSFIPTSSSTSTPIPSSSSSASSYTAPASSSSSSSSSISSSSSPVTFSSSTYTSPDPSSSSSTSVSTFAPSATPSSGGNSTTTDSGGSGGSGAMEPCEITVYTYAPDSDCLNTFNTAGACGISTYFPQLMGNGLPRLAVPMSIFDTFGPGQAQNNKMCGRTVTIKGANGNVAKAMVADRNTDTTFDLCMTMWEGFGYNSGGGRFDAQWSLDD